ncbi:MAG TPA: hypothetical protein VE218_12645 [Acidobacteriaceae bacterium]|nr:hypothetical protein [Acidobacteriaceae bacterium]
MLNSRDVLAGVVSQQAVEAGGRHQDGDDGEDAGKDSEQAPCQSKSETCCCMVSTSRSLDAYPSRR